MNCTSTRVERRTGAIKQALNLIALAIVSPCALTSWLERRACRRRHDIFFFWTHVFAILPGPPGLFLRRAFYRWTLEYCAEEVVIGFGTLFSRMDARLERGAYVGPYAIVGSVWLKENVLIGSRASLLSGGHQHQLLPSGEWSATDDAQLKRIEIGRNTWVGEAAILMESVGEGCMVAAGAVVSAPVPSGVMVGGNPARFIKRLPVPGVSQDKAHDDVVDHAPEQSPAICRLA